MKVGQVLQRARTKKEAVFMAFRDCFECKYFKGDERGQFRCVDADRKAECWEIFKEYWNYPAEPEEQAKASDEWRRR